MPLPEGETTPTPFMEAMNKVVGPTHRESLLLRTYAMQVAATMKTGEAAAMVDEEALKEADGLASFAITILKLFQVEVDKAEEDAEQKAT